MNFLALALSVLLASTAPTVPLINGNIYHNSKLLSSEPKVSRQPKNWLRSWSHNVIRSLDTSTTYPNFMHDIDGTLCSSYKGKDLNQIPRFCIFQAICNRDIVESREPCHVFGYGPSGAIDINYLGHLELGCQQQAICNTEPEQNPKPRFIRGILNTLKRIKRV